MQLARGQDHPLAQTAIHHHTECFVAFATIAVPALARGALLAIDVRLNGATITHLDVRDSRPHHQHLHPKLMTGNAGITEERHLAEITGKIGATDTDAMNAHQGFTGGRSSSFRNVDKAKGERFFELNGFHEITSNDFSCFRAVLLCVPGF